MFEPSASQASTLEGARGALSSITSRKADAGSGDQKNRIGRAEIPTDLLAPDIYGCLVPLALSTIRRIVRSGRAAREPCPRPAISLRIEYITGVVVKPVEHQVRVGPRSAAAGQNPSRRVHHDVLVQPVARVTAPPSTLSGNGFQLSASLAMDNESNRRTAPSTGAGRISGSSHLTSKGFTIRNWFTFRWEWQPTNTATCILPMRAITQSAESAPAE